MTTEVTNDTGRPERLVGPRPPIETCDTKVGLMIEGRHEWHEYCSEHGESYLRAYPLARYRDASLYEVLTSWREYRCTACNRLLWDQSEKDPT